MGKFSWLLVWKLCVETIQQTKFLNWMKTKNSSIHKYIFYWTLCFYLPILKGLCLFHIIFAFHENSRQWSINIYFKLYNLCLINTFVQLVKVDFQLSSSFILLDFLFEEFYHLIRSDNFVSWDFFQSVFHTSIKCPISRTNWKRVIRKGQNR